MEILFMRHSCSNPSYSKIYTKISYNGERIELGSTNIKILSENWDITSKRIKSDDPLASYKNETLSQIESDIHFAYNLLKRKNEPFDVKKLKQTILDFGKPIPEEKIIVEPSFIEVADAWQKFVKDPELYGKELSKGSLTKYRNVRDSLLNFLIYQKAPKLTISEFTPIYLRKFRFWMETHEKYAPLTVHKRCQVVKQIATWGVKNVDGCIINPIQDITFLEPEIDDYVYLTELQFQQLKNHKFRTQAKQEVADLFIIFCKTGFHYADLIEIIKTAKDEKVKEKHYKLGIDGKMWIYKSRIKTKVVAKVPYFQEVEEILNKYDGWANLPIKSNATMNDHLKLIAAELEFPDMLTQKLSIKAGRKTLVDWLLNEKGWSTDGVMVLLGIKNLRYLSKYGKADERRVVIEIQKSKKYQAFLEAQDLENLKLSNISGIFSRMGQ